LYFDPTKQGGIDMKHMFVLVGVLSLAACNDAVAPKNPEPASAELGFTYGDLMSGEEVRVTLSTLNAVVTERFLKSEPQLLYALAIAAQASGDGILCDLIMTRAVLDHPAEDVPLKVAGMTAQDECMLGVLGIEKESSSK